MRTGICSSDFEAMPANSLFEKLESLGIGVVQLAFSSITETKYTPTGNIEIPYELPCEIVDMIAATAKLHNVDIAAVNGTFNMAHPDPKVRREGLCRFDGFLKTVKRLGVDIVTLCSGTRNTDYLWAPHPDNNTSSAWNDMYCTMQEATSMASKLDITLAIESEASNIISTPQKARKLMDDIASPYLKMIMDCANLFHNGTAYSSNVRAVMAEAFEYFGDDVIIAHGKDIKESDGIIFCSTGEGIIDFVFFTEQLIQYGYKGDMLLHGIDDEMKIPGCIDFYENIRKRYYK